MTVSLNQTHRGKIQIPTDAILDSIADGVFIVDTNWRIISFNRAADWIIR